MKKRFNYFVASVSFNGYVSDFAFRTVQLMNETDVSACIKVWGRLRFGIELEVSEVLRSTSKRYDFLQTKIDW